MKDRLLIFWTRNALFDTLCLASRVNQTNALFLEGPTSSLVPRCSASGYVGVRLQREDVTPLLFTGLYVNSLTQQEKLLKSRSEFGSDAGCLKFEAGSCNAPRLSGDGRISKRKSFHLSGPPDMTF